jgi:antitoxin component YwqK of YwqJK toxin-antitoxin module
MSMHARPAVVRLGVAILLLALLLTACSDSFAHSSEEEIREEFPDAQLSDSTSPFVGEISRYFPFIADKGKLTGTGYTVATGRRRADGSRTAPAQGRWIYHYDTQTEQGPKLAIGDRRDNEFVGEWEFWHRDGERRAIGRFVDGKMDGAWRVWNRDGSVDLDHTGVFSRGKRTGNLPRRGSYTK